MTDKKIGDYALVTPDGTEVIEVQTITPASKKVTAQSIRDLPPTTPSAAVAAPVVIQVAASDEVTELTTGAGKVVFRVPYAFTLTGVRASLSAPSTSGIPTFDVRMNGSSILSTLLSIDAVERTSKTAATPAVISTTAVPDDAEFIVDVIVAGTGATGAKITLLGTKP